VLGKARAAAGRAGTRETVERLREATIRIDDSGQLLTLAAHLVKSRDHA
jgi:hypothetical protein